MASQMKSAGKTNCSSDPGAPGKPHWAEGMEPESNQASMTGSTRRISEWPLWHSTQGMVTSSMAGRWGSTSETSRPASSESSASDPTHRTCPSLHRQMGSGVPQ